MLLRAKLAGISQQKYPAWKGIANGGQDVIRKYLGLVVPVPSGILIFVNEGDNCILKVDNEYPAHTAL
jgi:hypothetical protein